jgi:hypothetical protein
LNVAFRQEINDVVVQNSSVRLTKVLTALGIPASSWYRQPVPEEQRRRPGPTPKVIDPHVVETVAKIATESPWYGYQRIAVMCRRLPEAVLERFHKTWKLEEVYWRLYDNPGHARECLEEFRQRYNERRPHWALVPETGGDPLVPVEVYMTFRTSFPTTVTTCLRMFTTPRKTNTVTKSSSVHSSTTPNYPCSRVHSLRKGQ